MANECSNYVQVTGDSDQLNKFIELVGKEFDFNRVAPAKDDNDRLRKWGCSTIPFDVKYEQDGEYANWEFGTKWCPPHRLYKSLKKMFPDLCIIWRYEEPMTDLYGYMNNDLEVTDVGEDDVYVKVSKLRLIEQLTGLINASKYQKIKHKSCFLDILSNIIIDYYDQHNRIITSLVLAQDTDGYYTRITNCTLTGIQALSIWTPLSIYCGDGGECILDEDTIRTLTLDKKLKERQGDH